MNALQQSLPPTNVWFLEIDDAYCLWYKKRFGKDIDLLYTLFLLDELFRGTQKQVHFGNKCL